MEQAPCACQKPGHCQRSAYSYKCRSCKLAFNHEEGKKKARIRAKKAENKQQRQSMRATTAKERAVLRRAQKKAAATCLDMNNEAMTGRGTKNLLSLPLDIRKHIYDLLFEDRSTFVIVASKALGGPQHIRLHQVCVLLRNEIQVRFFSRNHFRFKTQAALELWGRKHANRLAQMPSLEMNFSSVSPIIKYANCFQALRLLVYERAVCDTHPYSDVETIQSSSQEHLTGWGSFIYIVTWRQVEQILDALPQFRQGVVEHTMNGDFTGIYQLRLRLNNSEDFESPKQWYWKNVDMKIVSRKMDEVVAQLCKSPPTNFPKVLSGQKYKSWKDFIREELGRSSGSLP